MLSIFKDGVRVVSLHDADRPVPLPEGAFEAEFVIPANFLRPGTYSIALGGRRERTQDWLWGTDLQFFSVLEQWEDRYEAANEGLVNLPLCGKRTHCSEHTQEVLSSAP
jgi:lipopolysaccharide transport system ATP-binding protein